MRQRFNIKVELELHSISCPGVWLCPSGYVEVTLKSLGYFFKTGPMEPKFPLLAHELFVMEGFFKSVRTMADLERALSSEPIEIAIWQTGRRLAHYKGSLCRILQSVAPQTDCVHVVRLDSCIQRQIVCQLLMTPSRNFPGVIAPKVEISGRAMVRNPNRQQSCFRRHSDIILNLPPVEQKRTGQNEYHKNNNSEFRRQKPVCHASRLSRKRSTDHCLQPFIQSIQGEERPNVFVLANNVRYQGGSHSTSRRSSHSTAPSSYWQSQPESESNAFSDFSEQEHHKLSDIDEEEHLKSCNICRSYRNIFSS